MDEYKNCKSVGTVHSTSNVTNTRKKKNIYIYIFIESDRVVPGKCEKNNICKLFYNFGRAACSSPGVESRGREGAWHLRGS